MEIIEHICYAAGVPAVVVCAPLRCPISSLEIHCSVFGFQTGDVGSDVITWDRPVTLCPCVYAVGFFVGTLTCCWLSSPHGRCGCSRISWVSCLSLGTCTSTSLAGKIPLACMCTLASGSSISLGGKPYRIVVTRLLGCVGQGPRNLAVS